MAARTTKLSEGERGMIVGMHMTNRSVRDIVRKMGEIGIPISKTSVQNTITNFKSRGTVSRKVGSGAKPKLSKRDDNALKLLVKRNRKTSLRAICKIFQSSEGKKVSHVTIRNHLRNFGIKSYRCKRVPLLSVANKRKRLAWVKSNNMKDWNKIIYSDECRFSLVSDRPEFCLRQKGEHLIPQCTTKTVKMSAGIMVWGCLSKHGVGQLHRIPQGLHINANEYINILQSALIPSIKKLFHNQDYEFVHDQAPCHSARSVVTWLNGNNIHFVRDWPPQSPDLNIIEHIWDFIGRKLHGMDSRNLDELWVNVQNIWAHIPQDFINALYLSIPNRLAAVKKNRGGSTDY